MEQRRRSGRVLGLTAVIGLGLALPLADRLAPTTLVQATSCRIGTDKQAAPAVLPLGQAVTVTLTVTGACPEAIGLADVALVIDRSLSMRDPDTDGRQTKIQGAQAAARAFVDAVDPSLVRVGLILFDSRPLTAQPLTSDHRALIEAIDGIQLALGTNLVDALDAGRLMLENGGRPGARRVIVFMTDGKHSGRNPPIERIDAVIPLVRAAGISTWAIGFGRPEELDEGVLRRIADDADHYFSSPSGQALEAIYRGIAGRISAVVLLRTARVTDLLPPDMAYVPDSARPPAVWDAATRSLTWNLDAVPLTGVTLQFRVIPQIAGQRPTNVSAGVTYRDGLDQDGESTFPLPSVLVLPPTATPTPTATTTPTATPTATPTSTATPTATDTPHPVFLPRILRQTCPQRRLEVVLVLDASASMQAPAEGGGSKLAAAVAAARGLVGTLRFPDDRAAIVGFHHLGSIVQPLSASRAAVDAALERLASGNGTRIDLGLQQAAVALAERRSGARPAVILLTDGRQDDGRIAAVLAAADRVTATGATIYAIGLGADVDAPLLALVAGRAGRAYLAPSAADLTRVYRDIAGVLPCE